MPLPSFFAVDERGLPYTPEGEQQRKENERALMSTANAAASTVTTGLAPDPQLPGPLGYVPFAGMAEGALGTVDYLARGGTRLLNAGMEGSLAEKWGLRIPELPEWTRKPGEHFEATRDAIASDIDKATLSILPKPDINTPTGLASDIVGSALGAGVGFTPSAVINALPRGTKTIGSLLLPSIEHMPRNVPIATGAGLASGVVDTIADPPQFDETKTPAAPPRVVTQTETPPAASTVIAQAVQPEQRAAAPTVGSLLLGQQPAAEPAPATPAPASVSSVGGILLGEQPPGPTFTQQGNTETPLWHTGVGILITLGAIAGGRHAHRAGTAITEAGRTARFNNPDYAAKVHEYQNEVISRGNGGSISPPSGSPVAAPVPQGNVVHRTATYIADKTSNDAAKLQDIIRMTSADPAVSERLASAIGNLHDEQRQHNKMGNFHRTGYDKATNMTLPSVERMLDDFGRLDKQRQLTLGEGLRALNEIDNRTNNARKFATANPGVTPSIEDIAHDFIGHGTDKLHQLAADMRADPALADIATRYKQVTDGLIKMGEHRGYGFFTPTEARDILTFHPHYVSEMDAEGRLMHPLGERVATPYTGQTQMTTHPIHDLVHHVEQLYPLFERNRLNQDLYQHFRNVQQTNPQAAQFMTDVKAPTGAHASYYPPGGIGDTSGQPRDKITTVRTPTGVVHLRVDNPDVYHAMSGKSIAASRVRLDAANKLRRWYQQGTTGGMSMLTGRLQPLRNAIFTGVAAPFNAPRNLRAGLGDYALQRATGGAPNRALQSVVRGTDMLTNIPYTAASYAMGVGDRWAERFARLTHPAEGNFFNKNMRALFGDTQVDAMHQASSNRWQNSTTRWMKEDVALGGQGSPMHLQNPGVVAGTRAGTFDEGTGTRLVAARLSPKAFFSAEWMGVKPYVLDLQHAISETLSHISDAGHDAIARLNRGNTSMHPETLAYEMRNLVGNPARHGSGVLQQKASEFLPYTNVAVQGIGRTARAIGENPFGTALTAATGLGTMALISILTHMRSSAHLDFLQNQLSLQQREANVALALNDDPTKVSMFSLPQELRAAYAFMLDVMSKAVNTIAMRHDPDTFHGVWEGIKDFLGSHVTTSSAMAIRHGVVDMIDFANAPPIIGHMDWNRAYQLGAENLASAFHPSWTNSAKSQALPQQGLDTDLDSKNGQIFRNILSNVFGAAAATMYDGVANASRHYGQHNEFWDSMGMAIHDWIGATKQQNLSGNMIMEVPIRLSTMPPIAEALQPTLFALKNLPQKPNAAKLGYTTGNAYRLPVPVSGESPISNDPVVRQMLELSRTYSTLISRAMQPIEAIKTQMGAVQKMGMNAEERSVWLNKQNRVMADRYKYVDSLATDLEARLSGMIGKPIKVQDIDFKRDSSQFQ